MNKFATLFRSLNKKYFGAKYKFTSLVKLNLVSLSQWCYSFLTLVLKTCVPLVLSGTEQCFLTYLHHVIYFPQICSPGRCCAPLPS